MRMKYFEARREIFSMTQEAVAAGLIYLSAGNISVRIDDNLIAITPSGIKYKNLQPEQIAIVDLDGKLVDGSHRPSSEVPMHTHVFQQMPAVNAIFHTHSSYAITFAMLGKTIPVANLELFTVGAPLPVAPWACPGTEQPGIEAVKFFQERSKLKVVLLRNHGLLAIGGSLENAFDMAFDAEQGLRTYHQSLMVGKPLLLDQDQIAEVRDVYS